LYYTASFTLRGALVHLYFFGLPIDLQVVILEPCIAKDHALLFEAGDGEECPFGVDLVIEDYIYYFGDLTCFVREAIYIVYQYRTRDALGTDTFCMDKVFIYEVAYSSRVQEYLDGVHLTSVYGTDLDRKDDRRFVGIEGIGREIDSLFSHFGF